MPADKFGDTVFTQMVKVAAQELEANYHEPGYESNSARKHWQTRESVVGSVKVSEAAFLEIINNFNRGLCRSPARTAVIDFHNIELYAPGDLQGPTP